MIVDQPTHRVLGPLEVRSAQGRPLPLGGRKPRMLLATLLLDANRTVGTDLLVEVLWPAARPRSAVANLRTYASTLRAALGPGGAAIRTGPGGYAVEVAPDRLDLLTFEELVALARRDPAGAPAHLARALALWRGPLLCDLPGSPVWDRRVREISDARLAAAEELSDARLAARDYPAAIAGLRDLIAEQPFREDLWRRLVLALHWSGRRAEALRCYDEIRGALDTELGVDPGPELRRAHLAVLSGDRPPSRSPPRRTSRSAWPGRCARASSLPTCRTSPAAGRPSPPSCACWRPRPGRRPSP
ncbi:AfsR/SARP family transcriptional regulator [Microtetraspora niveoalba]|uniref:AfsR/SARP family transcriptional regulator n=1 Tax=Microtetraspora niveoalba TaxID=46175 RepID=UPI000A92822A|nr:AfsR/SARP family transcriptional regulator [Microtetraspora niveoalba]